MQQLLLGIVKKIFWVIELYYNQALANWKPGLNRMKTGWKTGPKPDAASNEEILLNVKRRAKKLDFSTNKLAIEFGTSRQELQARTIKLFTAVIVALGWSSGKLEQW